MTSDSLHTQALKAELRIVSEALISPELPRAAIEGLAARQLDLIRALAIERELDMIGEKESGIRMLRFLVWMVVIPVIIGIVWMLVP